MSVRTALTLVGLTLVITGPARAQLAFNKSDLPTHTALNRVGLERHWHQVIPLDGTERVLGLSMASSATPIASSVNDANPLANGFRGGYDLSPLDKAYNNFRLFITSGPLKGQVRSIIGYSGETRSFQFGQPFASAPTKGTKFALLDPIVFVQTNENHFYAYNGETGQLLWRALLGGPLAKAQPASVNSRTVFATSGKQLIALDRQNGERLWSKELPVMPTSPTACDEDLVTIGLENGNLMAFHTRASSVTSKVAKTYDLRISPDAYPPGVASNPREYQLLQEPILAWVWATDGAFKSRPLPTSSMLLFGAADGRVYGSYLSSNQTFFRFLTGGPIVGPLSSFGVRTLLVPSMDHNLYAIDIFNGTAVWTFASGAPIAQEPLVAGDDIFVQNTGGILSVVDDRTGEPRWSVQTNDAKLISVGKSKIYGTSWTGDLVVIDRKTGTILDSARSTREVKGLDLRNFTISLTNSINDRMYFVTPTGSLVCIRELDQLSPSPLRDLSQPAFGYVPPEGYPDLANPVPAVAAPSANPADAQPPM